ncbi:hypothetical protein KW801_02455, partial [Candidatus Saccharibacteria bacterium]|nr:hypothetical protein [Candidatus Saccharibacteria bacterium]
KNIILKDGRKAKMIPLTKDSFAGAVKKRMPLAAALAMDIKPGNGIARLIDPIQVEDNSDVHYLMKTATEVLSEISEELIFYGMPEGAKLAEV